MCWAIFAVSANGNRIGFIELVLLLVQTFDFYERALAGTPEDWLEFGGAAPARSQAAKKMRVKRCAKH